MQTCRMLSVTLVLGFSRSMRDDVSLFQNGGMVPNWEFWGTLTTQNSKLILNCVIDDFVQDVTFNKMTLLVKK